MKLKAAPVLLMLALGAAGAVSTTLVADEPNPGGIVFVGSSIFHRWSRLAQQMAPLPIVNIAFDGAETGDMLRLIDSRLVPMRPKVVAYYAGSNDIDAGEPAKAIVGRIRQFIERLTAALPDSHIIFMSINRAPEKQDRWDVVDAVNHEIEMYAAKHPQLEYIDVNPVLFNRDGTPRLELFLSDRLHFRPQAYEEFVPLLKPALTKALAARSVR
jgi:lysophospholipase L1-like esterase